jgi:hypothetical protein
METTSKSFAVFLMLIMAISSLSLIMVKPAHSQTTPTTPSVPEFSLKFVDASYDVSTTTSIDPYTGQTITNQGYHVQKSFLVMTIKNQPLVYQYSDSFYYNVKVKGHYEQWTEWSEWFKPDELPRANVSSSQTLITLGVLTQAGLAIDSGSREIDIPSGGSVDFQAEAMIGSIGKNLTEGPAGSLYFAGQTSGWSNIQTINLANGSVSISTSPTPNPTAPPTSNPTPAPSVPEFSWLMILPLFIFMLSIAVMVKLRKRAINSNFNM